HIGLDGRRPHRPRVDKDGVEATRLEAVAHEPGLFRLGVERGDDDDGHGYLTVLGRFVTYITRVHKDRPARKRDRMPPLWGRLLRHAILTGIALAVVGHLLGRAFLFAQRVYAGGAYNPENERVLWQTPLVMAGLGIAMTVGMDLLFSFVRRPVRVTVT